MKLTAKQIKDIATEVAYLLKPKQAEEPVVEVEEEEQPVHKVAHTSDNSGPTADAYDETEAALIREMLCPRLLTTRGKRGTVTINLTLQALDNLRRIKKERDGKGSVTYS